MGATPSLLLPHIHPSLSLASGFQANVDPDGLNILYVALTRAKNVLFVNGNLADLLLSVDDSKMYPCM